MATIAEVFAQALQHHQAGNLRQAEQLYRAVLHANPRHADSHHLLGLIAHQSGSYPQAVTSIHQALALNPQAAIYYTNLGAVHEAGGHLEEAAAAFQQAARLQPESAEIHNSLGNVLRSLGRLEEAASCCGLALHLRPDYAKAHNDLAGVLFLQQKLEDALSHYREALRLEPDYAEAHGNLGLALASGGQWQLAVFHYQEALRLNPGYAERLKPQNADAYFNLGNALLGMSQIDEAAASYEQAVQSNPGLAAAHCNLGIIRLRQDRYDEAAACLQRALSVRPDLAAAHNNLGCVYERQGRFDLALTSYRNALRYKPDLAMPQSNLACYLNYDPEADPDDVFAEHCRWGKVQEQETPPNPHANEPAPDRRLRIGYVSPDLYLHPLARYLEPVLAHHDPKQVEVFCYAEVLRADDVTARLQGLVHGWRSTCRMTDEDVARQVQADCIDILVDLAGHTRNSRIRVFAQKPAPVQVTWLGYMNTTGLTRVDYRLTDAILDPPGQPVRDTEELVRLPAGMCCFAPPADGPGVTPLPALERGQITFGSLNNLVKLNAKVFDLWSEVLRAMPSARMLIYHHTLAGTALDHVRGQFTDRDIAPERLDLRQQAFGPGYLNVYSEIDVCLDTLPCTGGVTTCESLWMGVPVVSLCGVRPASRNSAAIMARVGLADWAVQTPEQYIALAVRQAHELDRLAKLRDELRERMRTRLCDAAGFTRTLEDAYRAMWRRWCARQGV